MYMYDIHMHIIPGVDDGSWDMEMSRRLLFMAYEQGIRKILATPTAVRFEIIQFGKWKRGSVS